MIHANRRLGHFPEPDADGKAARGRRAPLWKRSTVWAAADRRQGVGGGHKPGGPGVLPGGQAAAEIQVWLREDDVAARLGVDPKTVRRWLNGRVPYPHNRAAVADLLGAEESDLWPGASGTLTARIRPAELSMVYPHRLAVPREVWTRFFNAAGRAIGILAYSALFLAEDTGILHLLAEKGRAGVNIRIAHGPRTTAHADVRKL